MVLTEIHRSFQHLAKEGPASGEDGFVGSRFGMQSRAFQQVACEMFGDQGIVGEIRIERTYQVVAIPVGIGHNGIAFMAA